jgi:hypothetical protein
VGLGSSQVPGIDIELFLPVGDMFFIDNIDKCLI